MNKNNKRKYHNKRSNGFDSQKEARYFRQLELLKQATDPSLRVVQIERQVVFELIPSQRDRSGKLLERNCRYIADFRVTRANGRVDVVDVKGFKTKDYVIKRKLMLWVHGIRLQEV